MNALIPWRTTRRPWGGLESMERRLGRLLDPSIFDEEPVGWLPAVDMAERNGEYVLTMELPGIRKEDVSVEVEDDRLVVKGEKKSEIDEKGARWHVMERTYGSFERSFTLPHSVQGNEVKAEYADGILTVHLPKRAEARGRRIEIGKK